MVANGCLLGFVANDTSISQNIKEHGTDTDFDDKDDVPLSLWVTKRADVGFTWNMGRLITASSRVKITKMRTLYNIGFMTS